LVYKLSRNHCVYSVLGEDAENTLWMIFYDFLYKYAGDDYKHLPGLIRRHLVQRLINTLKREGKRWDVEHYLDEDTLSKKTYSKDDLQDVLNNLALAQELDLLPTEQSQLLKDIYYKGTTQKQVAYSTNCSTRSIRRHHAKALNALHYKLTS
jgi:RNA polymerase sigma factor (sigma-70 family)